MEQRYVIAVYDGIGHKDSFTGTLIQIDTAPTPNELITIYYIVETKTKEIRAVTSDDFSVFAITYEEWHKEKTNGVD